MNEKLECGQAYYVNRIVDETLRREYFPDLLFRHGLPEASIQTVSALIRSPEEGGKTDLVDMEASGFFEAASRFLSPNRVALIKIVSDHLTGKPLPHRQLREWSENSADIVVGCLERLQGTIGETGHRPLSPAVGEIAERLRLTRAQRDQLDVLAGEFQSRLKNPEEKLRTMLARVRKPSSKRERNELFKELCHEFLAE